MSSVSPELKDGKSFKGSATIAITDWEVKPRWKWDHPGWLNADNDINHWWNQERGLDDWWEKIRKQPKPGSEAGSKGHRR